MSTTSRDTAPRRITHSGRHGSSPGEIADYALLSDLRAAALVGRDGSIDWLCLPRFDSPSCFARLLGTDSDGHWRIAPAHEEQEVVRSYRDGTLILETEFHTPDGVVRLVDTMLPHEVDQDDSPAVLRVLEGVSGTVEMRMQWVVRFAYGDSTPWVRRRRTTDGSEHILAVAGPTAVTLHGDPLPLRVHGRHAHEATFTVTQGQRHCWVMSYCQDPEARIDTPDPAHELAGSERFWRDWNGRITYQGPHADTVRRSLLTLKALTYAPTGAMVAAPTTSLPETPHGERNWDYRYCWLRDAALTLLSFDDFGFTDEATAWRHWLLRAVAGDPSEVQIMYGIDGSRHLLEWEAEWLPGYHGAQPVRIGNAAYRQLQLDVYGEVADALQVGRDRGLPDTAESWALQRGLLRHLERIWEQPDAGIWEVRGPARFFTYSRVMLWVAFDRAARAVREHGLPGPADRWEELAAGLHAEVCKHGFNSDVGAFTQYYGGTELDAAALRIPSVGFLPGTDERVVSTLDAISSTLRRGDLVDRYSTSDAASDVDGLSGREGSFLACSFWYVEALALAGRQAAAEAMFGRLLGLTNDVGLLAEEYDATTGAFTGNFPQAFSHLALVHCAKVLFGATGGII
ncbi:MAG: glycoside hydrolase family 15 protein [Sciscionella sp.]